MSSIAEFYSRNLANEVIKGLNQKVKSGGTTGRAPLGYNNVTLRGADGKEQRTVEVDPLRGPLMKRAFELYAKGDWTIEALAGHLSAMGLTTRASANIPSKPINETSLHRLLGSTYYMGIVSLNGVRYPGQHQALVDESIWHQVQGIMASHRNGERTRKHPHYLKGTVYCGTCGNRLIILMTKARSGDCYPYFVCSARHNKRNDCLQRATPIDALEKKIATEYSHSFITPERRQLLATAMSESMSDMRRHADEQQRTLGLSVEKLERQRLKILEAHYNDAISPELFKQEQHRIESELLGVRQELQQATVTITDIEDRLEAAMLLVANAAKTYLGAPDHIKKQLNQAIFTHIYVSPDGEISVDLAEPFASLRSAAQLQLPLQDAEPQSNQADAVQTLETTKEPALSGGLSRVFTNLGQSLSQTKGLFQPIGFSNRLLVAGTGFEPVTSGL